jgi:hypothetical protein
MATSWITLTEDDLRGGKAAALVAAFKSAARGVGEDQELDAPIASVCDRIRAEIQSGGKIRVSATPHAIPPSLKDLAVRMILWNCRSRLNIRPGSPLEPTEQDATDHRSDERYLERIARGEVTVETPADPIAAPEVQSGGMIETAQEGNSGNSREELSRL